MKKIVIYGLGKVGKKIAHLLVAKQDEFRIEIKGFCDKRKISSLDFEVFSPDKLKDYDFDYIVVTSRKWHEDIKAELVDNYGISGEKIVLFDELFKGERYYCNVCKQHARMFLPGGSEEHIFYEKKIIGGGYRENCVCPFCESIDRHRWLQYVLETETNIYSESGNKILHFAPELEVANRIREINTDYITADIVEGKADIVEDITDISFEDEVFDYIICNHVLEHIEEESKAFSELKRCIKEEGSIIMSVPICWEQKTFEDKRIDTSQKRERYYGQEDHVRIYGNDIEQHLKKYGFKVKRVFVNQEKYSELKKLSLILQDSVWILKK